MSERVVLDASVAMPLVHEEPLSTVISDRVRQWRTRDADLIVPSHLWLEVSTALIGRHRRPGRAVVAAIHQLDELGLRTVDIDRPLVLLALDAAERFNLTLYDAAYLAVAEATDALLFTADDTLRAAAGDRGVSVGPAQVSERPTPYGRDPTWPQYREASAFLSKLRAEAEALG